MRIFLKTMILKKKKIWEQKWEDEELYKFLGDGTKPRYIIDTHHHIQPVLFI